MKKLVLLLSLFLTVSAYADNRRFYQCVNIRPGYTYVAHRKATFYFRNGYVRTTCRTTKPGYFYYGGGPTCVGRNLYIRNPYTNRYLSCRVTALWVN